MNFKVKRFLQQGYLWIMLSSSTFLYSCQSSYVFTGLEGGKVALTSEYDVNPNKDAVAILTPYKEKKDSIMDSVIGVSEKELIAFRPESPLSNLAADILKDAATPYYGKSVDMGITNMGGLRNRLPEGEITIGTIYEIFPFENHLCIVEMDGKTLKQLLKEIAASNGEGISGATLVIDPEREVKSMLVEGQEIDNSRIYAIATLDFLAEGNDGMEAFKKAKGKNCYPDATIREIMMDYVKNLTREGKKVTGEVDGRIKID